MAELHQRIKMFPLKVDEADPEGAVHLPTGWHTITVTGSEMGRVYVWAYQETTITPEDCERLKNG